MSLRSQIDKLLKTDADFEAFVLDEFPEIQRRFSGGMDRVSKITLLLQLAPQDTLAEKLAQLGQPRSTSRARTGRLRARAWWLLAVAPALLIASLVSWILHVRELPVGSYKCSVGGRPLGKCLVGLAHDGQGLLLQFSPRESQDNGQLRVVNFGTLRRDGLGWTVALKGFLEADERKHEQDNGTISLRRQDAHHWMGTWTNASRGNFQPFLMESER